MFLFGLLTGITFCILGLAGFCMHIYLRDSKDKLEGGKRK